MEMAFEGTIINVKEEGFKDKMGEEVNFLKYTVTDISGDVSTWNSKKDFRQHKGRQGVIYVRATPNTDKTWKLSLQDFQVRNQERVIE